MYCTITKEGKIHLNRDLSKWRMKTINKKHAVYYEEAPSAKEKAASAELRKLLELRLREPSMATEEVIAHKTIKQREREGL